MAKKQQHEEHENHERWLVSYADFITLLFAFFVVMYSVSRVDNKRLGQVVHCHQVRHALQGHRRRGGRCRCSRARPRKVAASPTPAHRARRRTVTEGKAEAEQMRKQLQKRLDSLPAGTGPRRPTSVVVHVEGKRLIVRLSAARFFDANQAAIRPEMIPVLDVISVRAGGAEPTRSGWRGTPTMPPPAPSVSATTGSCPARGPRRWWPTSSGPTASRASC